MLASDAGKLVASSAGVGRQLRIWSWRTLKSLVLVVGRVFGREHFAFGS